MLSSRLAAALGLSGIVFAGLLAGSMLASGRAGPPNTHKSADRARAQGRSAGAVSWPRGESVIADVRVARIAVYRRPRDARPMRTYSNPTPQHTPLVFLARHRSGAWVQVLLPSRPNGSSGWLRAQDVALAADPYSAVVDLARRTLAVSRSGEVVLRAPIGVGRAATPTPTGLYYVTELLRQPDPNATYGPWAFALSAHSNAISHFGGGDGQIGLHGTDEPAGIGARVSHGCIRVRNSVIERLAAMLPLGTPVRIIAPTDQFTRA